MKTVPSIISADPFGELPEGAEHDEAAEPSEPSETRSFLIHEAQHGQRLDRALAALVPEFSRSYLQQLIEAGAVALQQRVVTKAATTVHAGEIGAIELRPTPQSQAFKPERMPITVLHEDEHLRVIDKPAGLVVHPAPGHWSGTLLNGLLALDPRAALLPRAGIVHRLDRDTSGLMVVARSRAAMDALVALIAARDIKRQYLALAHRDWQGAPTRHVDAAIGRDPRNRLRMAVVDLERHPGKPARTLIEALDSNDLGCAVRCTLETGRTHQIRVHMASIGHPLVGDALYGGAAAAGLERQALHAFRLAFVHPVTGAPMEFLAAPPPDLVQAMQAWGLDYNRA
ncbi:23S rRNA pseudouridine1911/1915/1917 synthase [Variovorax soli]|uniref:Pseudouridine synthase n=1 Tax=Variovorax soli TaxID=376815 RepID=A0ABU1N9R8_9BURK|nr:RluA family pseudouridine synthase [Variovorax soli]MDR6535194.1 23S rRNA pseudouridine1911/1915/1917 synthase [Variovorax soli]